MYNVEDMLEKYPKVVNKYFKTASEDSEILKFTTIARKMNSRMNRHYQEE